MSIKPGRNVTTLVVAFAALFFTSCTSDKIDEPKPLTRIAFGSCAGDWVAQPVWDAIVSQNPDLYISTGDAIYADWDGEKLVDVTAESLQANWDQLARRPGFANLKKTVPMIATWDNHDYGNHDRGADFNLKEESKRIFLDFWDEPSGSLRRQSPGIYTDYEYGHAGSRTHIILLDTKSFKTKTELLGEAQWSWLIDRLKRSADLRIIVSSVQIIPDEKNMDEWGKYPDERSRILKLTEPSDSTLLLSGNVHFAEISQKGGVTEITSSGLTSANINKTYAAAPNSYRLAGPVIEPHFGMLDIDWAHSKLNISIVNENGAHVLERSISIQ